MSQEAWGRVNGVYSRVYGGSWVGDWGNRLGLARGTQIPMDIRYVWVINWPIIGIISHLI